MKPELIYPDAYCYDCGYHIQETEFFGRLRTLPDAIFCVKCFRILVPTFSLDISKITKEDLIGG